jgi:hypothetical protein
MSMIDTVSLPGGGVIVLPVFSSKETFSSLPVSRVDDEHPAAQEQEPADLVR